MTERTVRTTRMRVAQGASFALGLPLRVAVAVLRGYRAVISPLYGPTCRFYPSCSAYALDAVQRHGLWRGGYLTGRRLLRCHPWNRGGVDPVPEVASGRRPRQVPLLGNSPETNHGRSNSGDAAQESAVVRPTPTSAHMGRVRGTPPDLAGADVRH